MKCARYVRYNLLFAAVILISSADTGLADVVKKLCEPSSVQNRSPDSDELEQIPDGDGGDSPDLRQGEPGSDQPSEDGTFNRLPNQPSDDDPPGCLLRERQLELIV